MNDNIICSETNIVEVHHLRPRGHKYRDNPVNLIPLCPTHHKYTNSRFEHLVESDILAYRKRFLEKISRN